VRFGLSGEGIDMVVESRQFGGLKGIGYDIRLTAASRPKVVTTWRGATMSCPNRSILPVLVLVAAPVLAQTPTAGHAGHAMADPSSTVVPSAASTATQLMVPAELGKIDLEARARDQRRAVAESEVFSFFRFTDRRQESGITFRHLIVDDAGKHYKMVHYDHGAGIAAADVDGDTLTDLYFTSQLGRNELWKNDGFGKFVDITDKAGVALVDQVTVGATFADFDNDGDPDLFVSTVRHGNVLFRNDGGTFTDISKAAGLDYVGHSSGAVAFDYDRDGLLDLFVTNVGKYTTNTLGRGGYYVGIDEAFSGHMRPELTETSILYRNLGGLKFEDVSKATGLVDGGWSGDAAAADVDGDGWIDLYVLNMQGDDHFWRNVEGKRFEEQTAKYFPKTPWGAMGIKFFDLENDGDLDLMLSDMHSDMSENIGPEREKLKSRIQWDHVLAEGENNVFGNALFRNDGKGVWVEVSDAMGAENYWPWGISVDDLNADGFDDVLVTSSMNYPFRYGVNTLLLNDGGKQLIDAEFALGIEGRADGVYTTPWFELDCGGADRAHDHCRGLDGKVVVHGALGTRSAVIFDLDGDRDLDIVLHAFNSPPRVLVSDLAKQTKVNTVSVELEGTTSNRDGLGAMVTVVAGGRRITKLNDGKSGYLSQSSLPLHFGLGAATTIEKIEVQWPSGITQVVSEGLTVGGQLRLVEPKK
jgi:hypothetical protein